MKNSETKKLGFQTIIVFTLFLFGTFLLYTPELTITGNVPTDLCIHYYERWGQESWFKDWQWWKEGCSHLGLFAICGNGILEEGEQCDTHKEIPCNILGFSGGMMKCTNCQFDTSECSAPVNQPEYKDIESITQEIEEIESSIAQFNTAITICNEELQICKAHRENLQINYTDTLDNITDPLANNNELTNKSKTACETTDCFLEKMKTCIPATYQQITSQGLLGNTLTSNVTFSVNKSCELGVLMYSLHLKPATIIIGSIGKWGEEYMTEIVYKPLNQELENLKGMTAVCNFSEVEEINKYYLQTLPFTILLGNEDCHGLPEFELNLTGTTKPRFKAEIGDVCYRDIDCPLGTECVYGICHASWIELIETSEVCCNQNSFISIDGFQGLVCDYYVEQNIEWNYCPLDTHRCINHRFDEGLLGLCMECSSDFHCKDQVCMQNKCVDRTIEICKHIQSNDCFEKLAIEKGDITICDHITRVGVGSVSTIPGEQAMAPFFGVCYYNFAIAQENDVYCDYLKYEAYELCKTKFT
ncbi:MAG: hypothetical protein ACMXYE_02220 [Candidatus Woesearchaeota archaeon]